PKGNVPEGTFLEIEQLIGRSSKTGLVKGEPILEPKLAPEGFKGGMTGIIPDGKRAITIMVNEVAGVAGFVLPGSRVDVVLTVDVKMGKEKESRSVAKVILENMLVLAVDQKMNLEEENPVIVNAVTLLVSPEETEMLALANNKGRLQLAMRNGMDAEHADTAGILCIWDMLNMGAKEKVADADAAPSHKFEVEVYKGNVRSQVTF
ncbi:MAG: Flp pilus assembly protein CpaB, partial [Candidatus Brocadiales bacterium]